MIYFFVVFDDGRELNYVLQVAVAFTKEKYTARAMPLTAVFCAGHSNIQHCTYIKPFLCAVHFFFNGNDSMCAI